MNSNSTAVCILGGLLFWKLCSETHVEDCASSLSHKWAFVCLSASQIIFTWRRQFWMCVCSLQHLCLSNNAPPETELRRKVQPESVSELNLKLNLKCRDNTVGPHWSLNNKLWSKLYEDWMWKYMHAQCVWSSHMETIRPQVVIVMMMEGSVYRPVIM